MANILITGGSRGIGAANVRRLAREGHRVCFIYKESIETAHSLTRVLQAEGCDVIGVQCDVRQPSQVQKVVDTMNNNWGGVDVLINGAGISWTGLLQDMLDAEWLDLFDTNVNGTFYCTRAVLPHMIAHHYGRIVNLGSVAAVYGNRNMADYSMTKGAVHSFTHALAKEVADNQITVNAVAPGFMVNERSRQYLGTVEDGLTARGERVIAHTPMGRFGQAADLLGAVSYLLDDRAAAFVTGITLPVDGGFLTQPGI